MNEREWFEVLIDSLGGFDAIRPQVFFKKCCNSWRHSPNLFDDSSEPLEEDVRSEAYNISSGHDVWRGTTEYVKENNLKVDEQEFVELF